MEKATFGAGCFWGVEADFAKIDGVTKTTVGYMGGDLEGPTYEDVCTDQTGHAEVCEVEFDPEKVSYEELLDAFWNMHNPTTLNKQGPDVGNQYRSAIFYYSDEQKEIAEKSKAELEKSGKFDKPIVTEITKASAFWKAEEYHQKYFDKNPGAAACHL